VRQPAGLAFGCHLVLFHCFQQRALRLGRRAVDLVREHQLGEDRSGVKLESASLAVVDRYADDIGRQQVTGELDALEAQTQGSGERVRQHGFAYAGNVFDQQVSARQKAGDRQPDLAFLAEDDAADLGDDVFDALGHAAPIVVNH
jgi:hypothetical protein